MSKYEPLWKYVKEANVYPLTMSFKEIFDVLGFEIDHSFLKSKKETAEYGFTVKRISLKEQFVLFDRV